MKSRELSMGEKQTIFSELSLYIFFLKPKCLQCTAKINDCYSNTFGDICIIIVISFPYCFGTFKINGIS